MKKGYWNLKNHIKFRKPVKNGEIRGCSASASDGGAINVSSGRTLTFEGTPVIMGNPATAVGTQKNVVLNQNSFERIRTTQTGLSDGANIGIYVTGKTNENPFLNYGNMEKPFGIYGKDGDYSYFHNDRLSTPEMDVCGTKKKASDSKNIMYWLRPKVTLVVNKTVTGGMGDHAKDFAFTVSGLRKGDTVEWTKQGPSAEDTSSGTATADAQGRITFSLKHMQTISLAIPIDLNITVTEERDGYEASFDATETNSPDTAITPSPAEITDASNALHGLAWKITKDTTLNVTNTLNSVIPTGVTRTSRMLWLIMLCITGCIAAMHKKCCSAAES